MFRNIGQMVLLLVRTTQALPKTWRQRRKVFEQCYEVGNASLLMVCVLSFFIGAVISLQSGPVLVERGIGTFLGGIVGITIAKELAPVMMAILIAGRNGSAMAAELGSMQVSQEIDALRTMNINPVHYLVLPRLVALAAALPLLVLISIMVGWFGGAVVAAYNTRISIGFGPFFENLRDIVTLGDVAHGVFKSFMFAVIVGTVCCHQGLTTRGGPRGVGRSVTKAVVNSIVLIVISDYFLTRILLK